MGKSIRSKIKKHHRTLKREAWGPIFAERDAERAILMTANLAAQKHGDSKLLRHTTPLQRLLRRAAGGADPLN